MNGRRQLIDHIERTTSQAQFARAVGCSESHLSLYLKGERELSPTLARRFAEQANIPLRALLPPDLAQLIPENAA